MTNSPFTSRVAITPQELDRLDRALAPVLDRLVTPALVIDLAAARHNINAMVTRCGRASRWRPHIKTIKQAALLHALHDQGVHTCKCATLDELRLALETATGRGAPCDVILAYPAHPSALTAALALAARHPAARVQFIADDPRHLGELAARARAEGATIDVLYDLDLGMGRTGTSPADWGVAHTHRSATPGARLTGLHGYDGHWTWTERDQAHRAYKTLCGLASVILAARDAPAPALQLVTSGTHSFSHALSYAPFNSPRWRHQVSPGTIVLSDRRSWPAAAELGLRQAAFVASRVISTGAGERITLDAGSKGISPDCRPSCELAGHPELTPEAASEEHLPLRLAERESASSFTFGQVLWLIPEHVCTTVNLYRAALLIDDAATPGEFVRRDSLIAASRSPWLSGDARA
jgi:D-serine deaminase-like pyridoxal phosphate-dependent protein